MLPGELEVGQFGDLEIGGGLARHHMPSKAYLRDRFGIDADDGIAIRVEHPLLKKGGRHRMTETSGRRAFVDETPRQAAETTESPQAVVGAEPDHGARPRRPHQEARQRRQERRQLVISAIQL